MESKKKLIRITTVPISLLTLISGQMAYMANNGFAVTMISSDFAEKAALMEKEQATFVPVKMTRTISPVADLLALYRLVKIFNRIKPDIIHSHTPKAGLLSMLAGKISGVPIRLHTVAGLPLMEAKGAKRKLLELVEKLAYRCATQVYPNSVKLAAYILDSGFCKVEKLRVIGCGSSNGINTEIFKRSPELERWAEELRQELGLVEGHFVYSYVGRMVRDKGVEELVAAFSRLATSYPNLRLLLLGWEEPHLHPLSPETLHTIDTHPAIIRVGYQPDVRPYLALSKVLVLPSYREGFPNVPMQAGCFDLPCIVSDINGCNEIIIHGENGLLVPPKDRGALQWAMEKIYTDQSGYQYQSARARPMIVERFEQQQLWQKILSEYQQHLKIKESVSASV